MTKLVRHGLRSAIWLAVLHLSILCPCAVATTQPQGGSHHIKMR